MMANWGGPREGAGRPSSKMMRRIKNGCEIIRGHGVEVGLLQTEEPNKPEAWFFWLEGQSLTSERAWKRCSRNEAIEQINGWLELIGFQLKDGKIEDASAE